MVLANRPPVGPTTPVRRESLLVGPTPPVRRGGLLMGPTAVYCEGPPSLIWGGVRGGRRGEPKKGDTIIPVYKRIHIQNAQ